MRYIDVEIARDYLHKACASIGSNGGAMLKIKFDEEPIADVKPIVHGEWIREDHRQPTFYCSVCGEYQVESIVAIALGRWNYCPNCGAEMH